MGFFFGFGSAKKGARERLSLSHWRARGAGTGARGCQGPAPQRKKRGARGERAGGAAAPSAHPARVVIGLGQVRREAKARRQRGLHPAHRLLVAVPAPHNANLSRLP